MANFFLAVYHISHSGPYPRTTWDVQSHVQCARHSLPQNTDSELFCSFLWNCFEFIHHVIPQNCEDSGYENTGWIELYFSIRDDIRDWCRAYLQLVFRCDSLKCLCKSACSLIGCCADSTPTLHAVYSGCTSCLFQEVKGKEKTIVYQIWIPSTYRYQAHLYRNTNQGGFMAQHYS